MTSASELARRLGQSVWYDYIRRGLLVSGEFGRLVELGVTGVTSNPTIFERAIAGSTDYDEALLLLAQEGKSASQAYEALAGEDIRAAADLLRPVYDRSGRGDGYACLEVRPELADATDSTVEEAGRLFAALGRPNVMIKVPATLAGIPAIRRLIAQGLNVNVTLVFSLEAYRQVMEAYIAGLEELAARGGDVTTVASVASFFVSRVDTAVDSLLEGRIARGEQGLEDLPGKAAVANARLAYEAFKETFGGERFAALRARGALVQRPLWASTGTKNPHYSDLLYVESLLGPHTVNTMPPATLTAFLDHGRVEPTLERGLDDARRTLAALEAAGIDMEQVTAKLLAEGVQSFADSFRKLMANVQEKLERLRAPTHAHPGASLGALHQDVDTLLASLQQGEVVGRIWRRDHTLWRPEPTEIADRLGWLTVSDLMAERVVPLEAFAGEVRAAGYRTVVLLGMGGSSLGPEVLRQTFPSPPGYPQLLVLDSTVPAWVRAVAGAVDPARTLFLVSSKSGTTLETLSLYHYFRDLVEGRLDPEEAGRNFVAITDPETPLAGVARQAGFRRVFLNPPDIGGRYSVLSYFGLVPAALVGLDLGRLLDRADRMREACASCVPCVDNPGASLGATMGALARRGRDKLTLVISPALASFGLWAEQLVAESLGKEGKGIIPVAGEPPLAPGSHGQDRFFVYLRLEGDDNLAADAAMDAVASAGHPVMRLALQDRYDLGGEFFRWEFATAVAGTILGVHTFDQPDVQEAKDRTARLLGGHWRSDRPPPPAVVGDLRSLLSHAASGSYLAVLAYLSPSEEVEREMAVLRRRVAERYHLATTFGYGPRYLHSTGQLHKGGPGAGLFLLLTTAHGHDLAIPGRAYTFGQLAHAQALGDLQALAARGRPAAWLELGEDVAGSLRKLTQSLG